MKLNQKVVRASLALLGAAVGTAVLACPECDQRAAHGTSLKTGLAAAGSNGPAQPSQLKSFAAQRADALSVVRDADTGELRAPTAEEAAALAAASSGSAALRSSATQPTLRTHAGGARSIRMTDDMINQLVAVRDAAGLRTQCFDSKDAAAAAMSKSGVALATAVTE